MAISAKHHELEKGAACLPVPYISDKRNGNFLENPTFILLTAPDKVKNGGMKYWEPNALNKEFGYLITFKRTKACSWELVSNPLGDFQNARQ